MKAKDVIKGIEEGFNDNEQISGAVAWVEDAANRLAEFEQDNHMQSIEIEKLKAENERLKAGDAAREVDIQAVCEAALANEINHHGYTCTDYCTFCSVRLCRGEKHRSDCAVLIAQDLMTGYQEQTK